MLKKPSGKLSKNARKVDSRFINSMVAGCEECCGAYWEEDEFYIDSNDCFIDEKYVEDVE